MRIRSMFILMVLLLGFSLIAVHAQDATEAVTPEATAEATETPAAPQVVRHVRLLYLSTDGPVLVPYLNNEPSAIQLLDAPAVSGWIDIPAGTTLSLIPLGEAQSNAVIGPLSFDNQRANWTTIVVLGSPANTGLRAFAINENYTAIPDGCARVTVLHALEGGSPVDVTLDDGTALASGLTFPMDGSEGVGTGELSEQAATLLNNCVSAANGTAGSAEATAEAETTTDVDMTNAANAVNALGCTTIVTTLGGDQTSATSSDMSGAEATAEAETTREAGTTEGGSGASASFGQISGNCGVTFDVPAGSYNLQVVPSGTSDVVLLGMGGTQFEANTYYLVVVTGTLDEPQPFISSLAGGQLTELITGDEAESAPDASMAEATAEATP